METGIPHILAGNVGTVYFNDWADTHGYGGVFKIDRITGGDNAAIRNPSEQRPQRDGGVLHPFYRGLRTPTISGQIIADSTAERADMEDLLRTVTDSILRADGNWTYLPSNAGGVSSSDYRELLPRLNEPLEIEDQDSAIKTFTIPLICASPYARSLGAHSGGHELGPTDTLTITNAGNAPYWPDIEVDGPFGTFTINNHTTDPRDPFAGETEIHWDGNGHTVANADALRILTDFERVTLDSDGSSALRYIDFSLTDFFPLWPGDNDLEFNASGIGGATKIHVYAYDGWVA